MSAHSPVGISDAHLRLEPPPQSYLQDQACISIKHQNQKAIVVILLFVCVTQLGHLELEVLIIDSQLRYHCTIINVFGHLMAVLNCASQDIY